MTVGGWLRRSSIGLRGPFVGEGLQLLDDKADGISFLFWRVSRIWPACPSPDEALSHLCAQGVVSVQALLHNSEARTRFAARVAEAGKGCVIDSCYRPTKVVFTILPKRGKRAAMPRQITPDSLFPLAQIAPANAANLLNSYGIEVEVLGVAVASMDRRPSEAAVEGQRGDRWVPGRAARPMGEAAIHLACGLALVLVRRVGVGRGG